MSNDFPCSMFVSSSMPRSNEGMRLIFSAVVGVMLGYLFGISFPTVNITKVKWPTCLCVILSFNLFRRKTFWLTTSQLHFPSSIISYIEDRNSGITTQTLLNHAWASANNRKKNNSDSNSDEIPKVIELNIFLVLSYHVQVLLALLHFGPLFCYIVAHTCLFHCILILLLHFSYLFKSWTSIQPATDCWHSVLHLTYLAQ
jgi:hypothetical protein